MKTATAQRRIRHPLAHATIHLGLLLVCAGYLLPFIWMISTSLKTVDQTQESPPRFIPHPWQPQNYVEIFHHPTFHAVLYTRNTLVIAILTVVGTTLSSAIVAYGFARIDFPGRGVLFAIMLATIMIPFPVTMVSLFRVFRWMDLQTAQWLGPDNIFQMLGTFKPLWLPAWFASAFNVFLLRQFFMTLPKELSEAARIDGCSEFAIFWRSRASPGQARARGRRPLQLHGSLERFSRPAGLHPTPGTIHPGPGPGGLPNPHRRHSLAFAHGRVGPRLPSDADPVFPDPADIHRRNRDNGREMKSKRSRVTLRTPASHKSYIDG